MKSKGIISLFLAVLIAALSALALVGCGGEGSADNTDQTTSVEDVSSEEKDDSLSDTKPSSNKTKPSSNKPSSKKQQANNDEDDDDDMVYSKKDLILWGLDPYIYSKSLKDAGNNARIAALMKKAQKGGTYKIAVLGGSISRGAGSGGVSNSYGYLVCEWWKENFPKAKFEFVNAGIGSTNPEMACYRLQADLLYAKPDFVVIDFAVNTYLDNDLYYTYSSLLYRILSQSNSPAVMAIDFARNDEGKNTVPNSYLTRAAKENSIPSVSYHNYIWDRIDRRYIKWIDISDDTIHPNSSGHLIASKIITSHLENVKKNLAKTSTKITAPKKPEETQYLNLGYIINTQKGVKLSGGFVANDNKDTITHGWTYRATPGKSELYIPLPKNNGVKVLMFFTGTKQGGVKFTGQNGSTFTLGASSAQSATLVDLDRVGTHITITPDMTEGSFTIYGVGVKY
ncbi:MAG: SGNH/GDSL hydrolase family protein [Clostridia bacterium]|nr:SGNH/GDSL hydrolase family protein [Clostridia bacterium]